MDDSYGADYTTLYNRHWWWRSRERILVRVIRALKLTQPAEILDVGCGNGLFLSRLTEFGAVRGIEVDSSLVDMENRFRPKIFTEPLGSPLYSGWRFDLITACDVIEHIENDANAIQQMVAMLKPGGYLLVTVPAFSILWDRHDELNHHYRRYRRPNLRQLIGQYADAVYCRYLFHSIFLPKLAIKLWNARRASKIAQHGIPHGFVNFLLQSLCYAEFRLSEALPLPFGTSVMAVAKRKPRNRSAAALSRNAVE